VLSRFALPAICRKGATIMFSLASGQRPESEPLDGAAHAQ
jgi:hypothetical protein